MVQQRVRNAPLCCKELRAVPVIEIERAERLLMEGLNYEFQCHHAADIIDEIFMNDIATSSLNISKEDNDCVHRSPRSAVTSSYGRNMSLYRDIEEDDNEYVRQKALDIAHRANIFSDVPFLFSPCDVAFAAVVIASDSISAGSYSIGSKLLNRYRDMNLERSQDERSIASSIQSVVLSLLRCKSMNFCSIDDSTHAVAKRAEELRRIMGEVATLRLLRKINNSNLLGRSYVRKNAVATTALSHVHNNSSRKRSQFCAALMEHHAFAHRSSKRTRTHYDTDFTPPRVLRTSAKITPTTSGFCFRYTRNYTYN